MADSVVLQAWQCGDTAALKGLLAENATFTSPVADYAGRANVSHMLGLIPQVLEDVRLGPEWSAGNETVSAFTARCRGDEMQGMLREQRDASGALVHVTLFLRPFRTLRAAIALMSELLARNPMQASAEQRHASPGISVATAGQAGASHRGDADVRQRQERAPAPATHTEPRPGRPVRGSATGRAIMALFDLIGRRQTLRIIWQLRQSSRPLTFRELRSACGDISSSVLTRRLHELTDVHITIHTGDGYALTDTGNRLVTSLQPVLEWSRSWNSELATAQESEAY